VQFLYQPARHKVWDNLGSEQAMTITLRPEQEHLIATAMKTGANRIEKPLRIIAVLRGRRHIKKVLKGRT
jgi:hypothetical protein